MGCERVCEAISLAVRGEGRGQRRRGAGRGCRMLVLGRLLVLALLTCRWVKGAWVGYRGGLVGGVVEGWNVVFFGE